MKLLVDIGNTSVKWATLEQGVPIESQSFAHNKTSIKTSLTSEWKTLKDIDAIYVANVAGDKIAQQLTQWAEKKWQLMPNFITSEEKRFGVTNSYSEPELLGVDRWLAIIAARQNASQATCIIDCGTAITVDIVTKYGVHQGGMILPGLSLMREALSDNTNMSEPAEESDFKTLAVNTKSAIKTGTLYTISASLERLINDLNAQFNNLVSFIITGGDAETILPLLNSSISHYPDIVLQGLSYYAQQGDKNTPSHEAVEA